MRLEDIWLLRMSFRWVPEICRNFELVEETGKSRKPILLKRGIASTLDELAYEVQVCEAAMKERDPLLSRVSITLKHGTHWISPQSLIC